MLDASPPSPEPDDESIALCEPSAALVSKAWLMTSLMLFILAAIPLRSRNSFAMDESCSVADVFVFVLEEWKSSMLSLFRFTALSVFLNSVL